MTKATLAPLTDIAHWRTHIFSRLLTIVLVLGIATALPSIVIAAQKGMWALIVIDLLAIAWLVSIWHRRSLPYKTRVLNFMAIVFFVSTGLMVNIGQVAQIYLIAPPVFAAVLLGMRPALAALAVSALILVTLGLAGIVKADVAGLPEHDPVSSILVGLNFLFVGSLITMSCATLLQRVAKSLAELRLFADSLEQSRNALQAANAELRLVAAAVAQLNDKVIIARAAPGPLEPQPIIFANDAFVRHTGYAREQLLGRSMTMFAGPQTDRAEVARIVEAMKACKSVSAELMVYSKSGKPSWIELEIHPFLDEQGAHTHWVAVGRDIGERRKAASAIHRLAFYDVLTGLPNRRLLMDRLEAQLAKAQAGTEGGALLFIDLDHFKYVNDARGHATGDALLRQAAQRLSAMLRGEDMVARIGGDEFVVLLTGLGHDETTVSAAAMERAQQIRAALDEDIEIDGHHYNSSASIGVALLPRPGQSVDDLLREADTAMYRAKAGGRNGVALFEATMRAEVEQRLTLERDLGLALARNELAMHLQLQFDADRTPVGAELLMRWRRQDGAMVPPDVFIPVAEATGLIVPLGQWAMREACLAWQALAAAGHPMPVSVNVSPSQFRQTDFAGSVRRLLEETGVPAGQLIFELTEGLVVDKRDATIALMRELAALGIRFSIDDFGTGYSNLAYLKRMPLYELKIDKSFIRDTPDDPDGAALVRTILAMAAHLRLRVVAEGVETEAQAGFLAEHGAPHMQGYLFARPLPLGEVLDKLAKEGERRAA